MKKQSKAKINAEYHAKHFALIQAIDTVDDGYHALTVAKRATNDAAKVAKIERGIKTLEGFENACWLVIERLHYQTK